MESNRDAFGIIRCYTGHKKSQTITGSLFNDENKSTAVAGIPNIAMLLGQYFAKNPSLTTNRESIHRNAVNHAIQNLATQIQSSLSVQISPRQKLIITHHQSNKIYQHQLKRLQTHQYPKKSSGGDSMPYSIMKWFNSTILLGLTIGILQSYHCYRLFGRLLADK